MKSETRREFLKTAGASVAALAAAGCHAKEHSGAATAETPAGMPPAFGTAPAVGPEVSAEDFAHAEKLVEVVLSDAERQQAAGNWRQAMAPLLERRVGPRKVALEAGLQPYSVCDPVVVANSGGAVLTASATGRPNQFVRAAASVEELPGDEELIAYAPVVQLSRWVQERKITSERLTAIYLERLKRFDPRLRCVITLTPEHAMEQARAADREIAAGRYRGPLHGIPWGAKDLLDTAEIRTTYGAEPFRDRVPTANATVTDRLDAAGAVLVAKLSLGALALNDVWFGGQTMNPWLPEEGSSGSSAGPASATAAGLVGFAIGSETGGSIVSPSMRCGVTGLRPTYGRVPRTGAMTLCWSLDKLGPMARSVEDTLLVLQAITGPDGKDVACVPSHLDVNLRASPRGLKVGYFPRWMQEAPATEVDRRALEVAKGLGMVPVEVSLPDWPYDDLQLILFAEAAAAFEELTLSGRDRELKMQVPDAWPNSFRQARFLSAVDYVQADRLRRKVALEMARVMGEVDLLLVPSLRDEMLVITNFTGHPSLTMRAGFVTVGQARSDWAPDPQRPLPTYNPPRKVPYGVTLIGRLFDEGTLGVAGVAMEKAFGVAAERPAGF